MMSVLRHTRPTLLALACLATLGAGLRAQAVDTSAQVISGLPSHLRDTGLYADPANARWNAPVATGLVAFAPQYPLWSDGSTKRRWISIPAGKSIDAGDPAAWQFPPGTRFWKEFAFDGPVETRMIERLADGSWRYAVYAWNADGTDAVLAPLEGLRSTPSKGGPVANYIIPAIDDCRGCHEGASVPPLGFTALQLSPDRDPLAPHARPGAADLRSLQVAGLLRKLPADALAQPPRIVAPSPVARAALGYLQANCGHCHNRGEGRVPVPLSLAQEWHDGQPDASALLATAVQQAGRYRLAGHEADMLVEPGRPDASLVVLRMASRDPRVQMPPLGTQVQDSAALELVKRWITELQPSHKEPAR
jgi:hypothetical protein